MGLRRIVLSIMGCSGLILLSVSHIMAKLGMAVIGHFDPMILDPTPGRSLLPDVAASLGPKSTSDSPRSFATRVMPWFLLTISPAAT